MTNARTVRSALGLLALGLLLPGAVRGEAAGKPALETRQAAVVESWERRLEAAEAHLRAGDAAKAHDTAHAVVLHMLSSLGGPDAGRMLARALVTRSLAQAGLGQMREAVWDWFAARALSPDLTEASLARAEQEGQALLAAISNLPKDSELVEAEPAGDSGISHPRRIAGEAPDYPAALWETCDVSGDVLIESFLDEEGLPHRPVVQSSPSPLLSLASLEALRSWRFKPVELDGKPVKISHTLTVHFDLGQCRSARKRASDKLDAGLRTVEPIAVDPSH